MAHSLHRSTELHVVNGDAARSRLTASGIAESDLLIIREALLAGPITGAGQPADLAALRAEHLADWYGADRADVEAELAAAWHALAAHPGDVVIHLDEARCLDCALVAMCALDVLTYAGRAVARSRTGVSIWRAGQLQVHELTPADVAAGAGAWRLIVDGDVRGLRIAAFDLDERGGIPGLPELGDLLRLRADDLDGRGLVAGVLALRAEIGSSVPFDQLYRQWRAERDPGYGAGDATIAKMLELHDA